MKRTYFCIILALLVAPLAVRADSKLEPPDLERYLRWGPLRVRPGLGVSNLGYDDNVFLARGGQEPISDYTATVSPRVDGLVLFGDRAFLTFRERLDYTLYVSNGDQNFLNNLTRGRLTVPLKGNQIGFFAEMRLSDTKERPIELEDLRPERRDRRFAAGAIVRPGWRSEIELGYSTNDISYTDEDFQGTGFDFSQRLNRTENALTLDASHALTGRTRLVVDALSNSIEFDSALDPIDDGIQRDTDEWRLLAGVALGKGGPLSGTFKLGWGRIDALNPALPDLSELMGEAELAYKLDSFSRLSVEGDRLPGFSVWGDNAYFLRTTYGVRYVRFLNRLLGVEAGVSRGTLTFPESATANSREDRLRRYDVGIRLRLFETELGRRAEYSFRLGRYRRDSSVPDFDSSQNTFTVGVELGY